MILAISVNPISSSTQNSGTSEIRELLAPISTVSPGTEFEGLDIAMQADPTLELTKNLLAVESQQDTLTGTDIATSLLTGSNPKVGLLRQTKGSSVGAVAAMVSGDDSGEGLSHMSGSAEEAFTQPMIGLKYGRSQSPAVARPASADPHAPAMPKQGVLQTEPKPRDESRTLPRRAGEGLRDGPSIRSEEDDSLAIIQAESAEEPVRPNTNEAERTRLDLSRSANHLFRNQEPDSPVLLLTLPLISAVFAFLPGLRHCPNHRLPSWLAPNSFVPSAE
jgi:hypothetical protein